jgi:hypothetical protein
MIDLSAIEMQNGSLYATGRLAYNLQHTVAIRERTDRRPKRASVQETANPVNITTMHMAAQSAEQGNLGLSLEAMATANSSNNVILNRRKTYRCMGNLTNKQILDVTDGWVQ